MKIIQITTDVGGDKNEFWSEVYGLGDDNKVYYWSAKETVWKLWKKDTLQ